MLRPRACLKNHSRHLHAPFCVIFMPNSVNVARYASFIWHKSPTNCDAHLTESIFQTRSSEAQEELKKAVVLSPGPWEQHSKSVAKNAMLIAEKTKRMDSEQAYVMGLMHDIGRRAGIKGILHIFDGYDYMMSIGQEELAHICLTHSFPIKDVDTYFGKYDCTSAQKQFLQNFLEHREYTDYDLLIQLCDAVSLPNGACIMEKRLVDVALRHGLPDFTIDKWKAFMNIKKYFDELCDCNIYSFLPNVLENSSVDLI